MGYYSSRLDEALSFSAWAHGVQVRKGTDIPYVTHPVHVAWLLQRYGFDEDIVIAGLLHDVLEDTRVTFDEVHDRFGPRVAQIVEGCSEPRRGGGWWEDRKEDTIERMRTASADVRAVTCADKLHNLSTIRDALEDLGENVWRRFGRGRPDQSWYYCSLLDSLSNGWDHPMLDELREVVNEVFGD